MVIKPSWQYQFLVYLMQITRNTIWPKTHPYFWVIHFDEFIQVKINDGRFASTSEAIRAGLRLLEAEEVNLDALRQALREGEESGYIDDFDPKAFKRKLHEKMHVKRHL